jgi:hypothetical protein
MEPKDLPDQSQAVVSSAPIKDMEPKDVKYGPNVEGVLQNFREGKIAFLKEIKDPVTQKSKEIPRSEDEIFSMLKKFYHNSCELRSVSRGTSTSAEPVTNLREAVLKDLALELSGDDMLYQNYIATLTTGVARQINNGSSSNRISLTWKYNPISDRVHIPSDDQEASSGDIVIISTNSKLEVNDIRFINPNIPTDELRKHSGSGVTYNQLKVVGALMQNNLDLTRVPTKHTVTPEVHLSNSIEGQDVKIDAIGALFTGIKRNFNNPLLDDQAEGNSRLEEGEMEIILDNREKLDDRLMSAKDVIFISLDDEGNILEEENHDKNQAREQRILRMDRVATIYKSKSSENKSLNIERVVMHTDRTSGQVDPDNLQLDPAQEIFIKTLKLMGNNAQFQIVLETEDDESISVKN